MDQGQIFALLNGPTGDPGRGTEALINGAGYVAPPSGGNRDNPYAQPPVQVGNYEYIIPQMYPNLDITNIPAVPTSFIDWSEYGVDLYDASGLTGGGFTGDVPQVVNGPTEYYDETTGLYVNLGSMG